MRWSIFDNPEHGVVAAMRRLGIHVLGLPAARLSTDFELVVSDGLACFAWGGPSYASFAFIWCWECGCVSEDGLGCEGRLWVRVTSCESGVILVATVYLPVGADAGDDSPMLTHGRHLWCVIQPSSLSLC